MSKPDMKTTAPTNYYLKRQHKLLKNHHKMMQSGQYIMRHQYEPAFIEHVIEQTEAEFIGLIPEIPYIGGADNPFTDTLEQMTTLLALYRVLRRNGRSLPEIGELVRDMAQHHIEQFPRFLRQLIGRLYMTKLWRKRTLKKAAQSQKRTYASDFVYEVVENNGQEFAWGVNYQECGVVKFFAQQNAAEFTPYMCLIDYLVFPSIGIHLKRTGTIANGCSHCDFRFVKNSI